MRNILKKINKKAVIIAVIVVVATAGYFYFTKEKGQEADTEIAVKKDIIQTVSVTGKVKPAKFLNLGFEKSGRISGVYLNTGDKVWAGNLLVSLENGDLLAQLKQYEGNLEAQKAKLEELEKGTRPEEITVQEAKVINAQSNLEETKKNLVDKIKDSYTKSDDAVRGKIDQYFSNARSSNPQINFTLSDNQIEIDLESGRSILENILTLWNSSLSFLTTTSDLTTYTNTAKQNLNQISSFLEKAGMAVNSLTSNSSLSESTISTWKTDTSTARTNVNTAITNLSTAEEKKKSAETTLAIEQETLLLKKAGSVPEQILAQEAQVKQAEANIENIRAQISKTLIYSPISGIVSKQDAKKGEIAGANTTLVSVVSDAKFEIEANVPEADIAKIKIGDEADITLDAYGNDVVFRARVFKIDPAETIIEGVSTYKITLQFINEDDRLKSGMTANIDVFTASVKNAIVVSQRAVIIKGEDKIVRVLSVDEKEIKEVKVKTGLLGSDGYLEITEGINEGDKVIVFVKN